MLQFELEGKSITLTQQDNILVVRSKSPLRAVGSAFHNGGAIKETQTILNIEVPKNYGDNNLHMDPEILIADSQKKLGLEEEFLAMVTAACVKNFSLASARDDGIGVSVVATAADDEGHTCDHAESSGETIDAQIVEGTINIIVVIDGNPTESCLVGTIITATEAKTAAMLDLDIRSRYSGEAATGTITDAIVCCETGVGEPILYGGPASKLGQLVGSCTRQAVKEAIMKGRECRPNRSLVERLRARKLSLNRLAEELAKVKNLNTDKQTLEILLRGKIENDPAFAAILMATVKFDEEIRSGLLPAEYEDIKSLGQKFGDMIQIENRKSHHAQSTKNESDLDDVDLPIFLKHVLISLLQKMLSSN